METIKDVLLSFYDEKQLIHGETLCENIIFRDEFIDKCAANHCGQYNKKWSCPPAISSVETYVKKILNYKHVSLFSYIGPLEDNYDVEGMDEGRKTIMSKAYQLKKILKDADADCLMLGAGSCELCQECTYPDHPCRHPDLLMIPMEALGIDVYELSKSCKIKYTNGALTVTYFCVVIY